MATLAEHQAQQTSAGTLTSLKQGTVNRSLGGTPVVPTAPVAPKQSPVAALGSKIGAVGSQTLNLGESLAKAAGNFAVHTGQDIVHQAQGAYTALKPYEAQGKITKLQKDNQSIDQRYNQVVQAYKSGAMSRDNYVQSMKDISASYSGTSNELIKLQKEIDPTKLASDVAWTAINVLTAGGGGLVVQGGKQGAEIAGKEGLNLLLNRGINGIETAITKVPAMRELLERNAASAVTREAQKLAGESTEQWLAREGKSVAVGLLIKRPIFYQTNVGLAQDTYKHIIDGKYDDATKSAAWIGAQMVGGGPIGFFLNQGKKGIGHLGELANGKGSFIDEVSSRIGDQNPAQIARFLTQTKEKAPEEFKNIERTFRILQETNLNSANNKVDIAVDNVLSHYVQHGIDLANVTPSMLYKDMSNWAAADELVQKTIKQGIVQGVNPEDAGRYAVVRFDSTAKAAVANAVQKSDGTIIGMSDAIRGLSDQPGVGWGNNRLLMNRIEKAISQSVSKEDAAKAIREISTASTITKGIPKTISAQLAKLGYTVAEPYGGNKIARLNYEDVANSTRKLVSGAIKDPELFDASRAPEPILNTVVSGLTKIGLSPESSNVIAHQKLSEALIGNLDDLGLQRSVGLVGEGSYVNGGRAVLSELERYVETKRGAFLANKISSGRSAVTDIRQLTNDEIATALKISKPDAKLVSNAIRDAYTKVPLELRGLGDKIVDYAMKPTLSPMRYYTRIQSALRYTYNPFFRFQEQVETSILARMKADKFLWLTPKAQLDETVKTLEKNNVFNGNIFGTGADDNVIGRISANLTQSQKRNLAGLAETIAQGQGKTVAQVLRDNPEQIDDALRVIVQYARKGALSSPLARTLNIVFFPMRYNAKVTVLAAEKLATLPPSVQYATIQGLFKMKDWLKSDEGLAWQAEHADAIQVFNWATPVGNITSMMKVLTGKVDEPGDLGLLGGLPFGIISQILDGQGIINLNKPYVNPKTGDVYPDYIPQTTKARAAVALQDLLGSMFSFPGRTLGLPGKDANLRKVVDMFISTNGKDFDKRLNMDELTPLQKNMVRVLKGDTSPETLDSLYTSPAPGQFNYYTIPPVSLPVRPLETTSPAIPRRTGLPTKADLKAAKKATRDAQGKKIKPLPQPIPAR